MKRKERKRKAKNERNKLQPQAVGGRPALDRESKVTDAVNDSQPETYDMVHSRALT